MAVKYLDLDGLTYFKNKLKDIFFTEEQVTQAINESLATYKQGIVTIVQELPEQGEEGYLYLKPDVEDEIIYTAYAWENNDWVQMGSATLDLSDYITKSELKVHTDDTNIHVSSAEKTAWNNKLDESDLVSISTSEIDGIMV